MPSVSWLVSLFTRLFSDIQCNNKNTDWHSLYLLLKLREALNKTSFKSVTNEKCIFGLANHLPAKPFWQTLTKCHTPKNIIIQSQP